MLNFKNWILLVIMVLSTTISNKLLAQKENKIIILKIRSLMTETEFRKAGLHKLTAKELNELDKWMKVTLMEILKGGKAKQFLN